MRASTIFAGVLFATSALTLPIDTLIIDPALSPHTDITEDMTTDLPLTPQSHSPPDANTITDLLPTMTSTLSSLGAQVDTLIANVSTADLNSTLNVIASTLTAMINDIETATAVTGVELSNDLNATVTEAQDLLERVQSLVGLVNTTFALSIVETLAAQLVDLLTGLV